MSGPGSSSTSLYSYSLSPEAYAVPLLHAASHLSSTITGLFLGTVSPSPGSSSSSSAIASTSDTTSADTQHTHAEVTRALPLQHLYTSLSPVAELGLELAQSYAEINGLRVLGLYVAKGDEGGSSGKGDDRSGGLGRAGERMLSKIREGFEGAFGLTVDNERLSTGQAAYTIYLAASSTAANGSSMKSLPHSTSPSSAMPSPFTLESSIPAKVLESIRAGKIHKTTVDLDDHLEDSAADWLENGPVKRDLKRYL